MSMHEPAPWGSSRGLFEDAPSSTDTAAETKPTLLDTDSSFQGNWRSIVALIIIFLVGSVANSAGVGGGAIFIPVLQSLVGFTLKDSTAISQALITAGSVCSVAINIFKRAPDNPTTCVINFSVALALTPFVLVGVSVGVILNSILPEWLLTILLIVLIFFLSIQSIMKGVSLWKQETKRKAQEKAQAGLGLGPPATTLHEAAVVNGDVGASLASAEGVQGSRLSSGGGISPPPKAVSSQGLAAAFDSMEGLPVRAPSSSAARAESAGIEMMRAAGTSRTVGSSEGMAGGQASSPAPRTRAGADWWQNKPGSQRMNQFMDALLGPVTDEMLTRTPDVDEGSWLQRRNKRAWRMLLQAGGELGQQFPPDFSLEHAQSMAPGTLDAATAAAAAWEAAHAQQRLPLLPEEPRSHQHPVMPAGRPKPVQPPLPAEEAGEILRRLDHPAGFRAINNPLHERQPSLKLQQQQQQLREQEKVDDLQRGLDEEMGTADVLTPSDLIPPKPNFFTRLKKRSTRFRSDLQRVPKRSVGVMFVCWAIFVILQVLRTLSTVCSATYWVLLALQLGVMLLIGLCIATWMQRKVSARKKEMRLQEPMADGEDAVELTPMHTAPNRDGTSDATTTTTTTQSTNTAGSNLPSRPVNSQAGQQHQQLLGRSTSVAPEPQSKPQGAAAAPASPAAAARAPPTNPLGETGRALATSLSFCCFAGLVAGLLGLGGGMIIGPLLLGLHVHPQVSAATSSLMVTFSSSAALISFAVAGRVNGAYAGVYAATSVVASMAGIIYINDRVKRSGRTSIVVFMLATIMVLGFCVITAFGVINMVEAFKTGNIGVNSLCD